MKLNPSAFALATASAVAIVWILCFLLVSLMPGMSMNMSNHMLHTDLGTIGMQWHLSLAGFVIGLIIWSVFAGILAWLIATFYNRFS